MYNKSKKFIGIIFALCIIMVYGQVGAASIPVPSSVYETAFNGTKTIDYTDQLARDLGLTYQTDGDGLRYLRISKVIYRADRIDFGEYLSNNYIIDMKFKVHGSGTTVSLCNAENAAKTIYMEAELTSGTYGTTLRKWANGTINKKATYADKKLVPDQMQTVKIDHDYISYVNGTHNVKNNVYLNDVSVGSVQDYMYTQKRSGSFFFPMSADGYVDIYELKVTHEDLAVGMDTDGNYITSPISSDHTARKYFGKAAPKKFTTSINFKVNTGGDTTKSTTLHVYTAVNSVQDTYYVYEVTKEWGVCRYIKNTGDTAPAKVTPVKANKIVYDQLQNITIVSEVTAESTANGTRQIKNTFYLNGVFVTEDSPWLPVPDSQNCIKCSGTATVQIYNVETSSTSDMNVYYYDNSWTLLDESQQLPASSSVIVCGELTTKYWPNNHVLISALYKDNKLESIDYTPVTFTSENKTKYIFQTTLTTPENTENCCIKTMLWNNWNNISAVSSFTGFKLSN